MWQVVLVHDCGHEIIRYFGEGYFPRKYFRRRDADRLVDRVARMGGAAQVVRFKK